MVYGTKTLAAEPLGPVGYRVWPLWIGFVSKHPIDAQSVWDGCCNAMGGWSAIVFRLVDHLKVTFRLMPGPKVSQQNIVLYRDDQCSLHLPVVLTLLLNSVYKTNP